MSDRRGFIKQLVQSNLLLWGSGGLLNSNLFSPFIEKGIDNPYQYTDWKSIQHIPSTSHIHINNQEDLDKAINVMKLRHIPISNYYPSAPFYPLEKIREHQFQVKQNFKAAYNKNFDAQEQFINGPIDWNKIIMDPNQGWYNQLPDELKKELPFKTGKYLFPNVPKDVIISPNAEHHNFTDAPSMHANSIGSMYSSGTFDAHNKFKTVSHGYSYGTGISWKAAFKEMKDQLLFANAGGITINHPTYSSLAYNTVCSMLDFGAEVLGIEVYNDPNDPGYKNLEEGWAVELWDQIINNGRRCFGFFVPDHTLNKGQNILLVPKFTQQACLMAYRQGAFYGAINGSGLRFSSIDLANGKLRVTLNKKGTIHFITNLDRVKLTNVSQSEFTIPMKNPADPAINYVRIEAEDELGERLFSQPIRFIS